jgi:GNAT superfamily N-acetyltransferase
VRRIAATEGRELRRMRLAAIADSPGTFATTLAVARARPFHRWDQVAEASSAGFDQATWFAEHGGDLAGMINAYRTADGTVTLTSLWAAPGHRHLGVADALVARALRWAAVGGARRVRLWVVERNEDARAFYRDWGFAPTGREIEYEPDPRVVEIELERPVEPADRDAGDAAGRGGPA